MPPASIQAWTVCRIGVVSTPPQSVMTPRNSAPFVTLTILGAWSPGAGTEPVQSVKDRLTSPGRRNVGDLGYKREQPEPDAGAPLRGVRGRSHSPDWKQHMPSRTRKPDLPAVSDRVTPSATTEPAGPPDSDKASETNGTGTGREPAWNGPRLVRVPDGWPPYDCETHGAACSAAPEAGRQPPRPAAVSETAAVGETTGEAAAIGEAAAAWNTVSASAGMTVGTAEAGTGRTAGLGPALGRPAGPGSAAGPNGGAGHAPGLSAAWPRQFAQVLVEILAGFRPAKQLAP